MQAEMSQFYWIVGAMVIMNLGTIVAVLASAGKAVWWMARLDLTVEKNNDDVNKAFEKIRELEKKHNEQRSS